jgi:hypothetical protein
MKIRFAVDQRGSSHVTRCASKKNLLGGHFNRKGNSRVELGLNAEDGVQGNIDAMECMQRTPNSCTERLRQIFLRT